jgi:hypothetical protein
MAAASAQAVSGNEWTVRASYHFEAHDVTW